MLLGPIFRVEIVSTARRRRYFALRVLYGALILLVLWISYEETTRMAFTQGGQLSIQAASGLATAFFVSFSWLQMLAILVVGPAMAVGTIASERERRTIEYLFASDLANHEIVLGKTFARLMLLGKLVLVGLPILFLFRLLGGIPANLLLATFLLASSTALMITALGICVSVWSARARDATIRVYLLLATLIFVPLFLWSIGQIGIGGSRTWQLVVEPAVEASLVINPIWVLGMSMANPSAIGFGLDMATLLEAVGWQSILSVVALVWATAAVRRVHLGDSSRGTNHRAKRRLLRLPQWRPAVGNHPMIWKEMFAGTAKTRLGLIGTVAITLILCTVAGVTIYVFLEVTAVRNWGRPEQFFNYLAAITGYIGTCILLLLAARAAGLVTSERERDCWMSLMATPLTGREIMRAKMWGNLYSVRWSLFVLASAWTLGLFIQPGFIVAIFAMAATFVLAAWYVTNLGLAVSLRSQTTLRSMGLTLATLLFTGGGYLFCCCTVMGSTGPPEELMFSACIPFLLVFPPLLYHNTVTGSSFGSMSELPVAYVGGVVLYLIAGTALYFTMTERFDRSAGRCSDLPEAVGQAASSQPPAA